MSTRSAFDQAVFNHHFGPVSSPASGSNLSITPPVNTRSELLGFSFEFNADSNVADRHIRIFLSRGIYGLLIGGGHAPITADQDRRIIVSQTGVLSISDTGDSVYIPIASLPVLLEGDSISTDIQNIQAGDISRRIFVCWKTWTYDQ